MTVFRFFVNNVTKKIKKEGDMFSRPVFAKTLREIATKGVEVFYNGTLGDQLVADVQKRGGILTKEDLKQYT